MAKTACYDNQELVVARICETRVTMAFSVHKPLGMYN